MHWTCRVHFSLGFPDPYQKASTDQERVLPGFGRPGMPVVFSWESALPYRSSHITYRPLSYRCGGSRGAPAISNTKTSRGAWWSTTQTTSRTARAPPLPSSTAMRRTRLGWPRKLQFKISLFSTFRVLVNGSCAVFCERFACPTWNSLELANIFKALLWIQIRIRRICII